MTPLPSPQSPWSQLSNKKILVENWLVGTGMGMEGRNQVAEECGGTEGGDGGGKSAQPDSGKAAYSKAPLRRDRILKEDY